MMRKVALLLLVGSAAISAAGVSGITSSASELCLGLVSLLPVAAMLMVALSGVVYAAGQLMGAETRARAVTWATACMAGAIMAVLITVIGPAAVGTIYPGVDCSVSAGLPQPVIQYTQPCTASQGCICRDFGCRDAICANGETCVPCATPAAVPTTPARCT